MTKRIIITFLAAAVCCWGIWQSARIGLGRTLAEYAVTQSRDHATDVVLRLEGTGDSNSAAGRAVALLPLDAETHAARAVALQLSDDFAGARDEFRRAVQLRPRDYYLWMLLGITRDQNEDQTGALRALQQSVVLAPSYAAPHWQLGNLLLRLGQLDQGFFELRQAAQSNPSLWPNVDDLAWGVYAHDPNTVVRVIRPESDTARLALALFFARHDQGEAALEQFRAARNRVDNRAETLLDELLKGRAFSEAYEVWANLHGVGSTDSETIRDGGFEGVLTVGQKGFGWQVTSGAASVSMSIDEGTHQSGSRSLRLDFHGNSDAPSPLVAQIVLVKPHTRYHLGFAALSKDFVSAADAVVTIIDASDPKNSLIAQSPPLRSDPGVWRDFALDFATNADTRAITIILARQTCASNPCPAFGTVWLDSVSIENR